MVKVVYILNDIKDVVIFKSLKAADKFIINSEKKFGANFILLEMA